MGACATKPLDPVTMNKPVPEEVHEENSTPRSAEVTPTSAETAAAIAEEVDRPSEVAGGKNDEEKPGDVSESKPTTAPEEQKFDDNIEKVPKEEPCKEKETVEHVEAEANLEESKC